MHLNLTIAMRKKYYVVAGKENSIMLLQFNVTNALSFKNEAILDLVANNDSEHLKQSY